MLYHVFLILVTFHFVWLTLGILKKDPNFILVAMLANIMAMGVAGTGLQYPYVLTTNTTSNTTTDATGQSSTSSTGVIYDTGLVIGLIIDPLTPYFLLVWLVIDIYVWGSITRWGGLGKFLSRKLVLYPRRRWP